MRPWNILFLRTASPYARVTNPRRDKIHSTHHFKISKKSKNAEAFNITETEGIVFVDNAPLLPRKSAR